MHRIFPLCFLLLAADPDMFENPWADVRLTITRDPYSSSEQVTLCRVRATNQGSRRWPGRALAFEARARGGGVTVRERGRFGLELPPYGYLETLISLPGRHDFVEVVSDRSGRRRCARAQAAQVRFRFGFEEAQAPPVLSPAIQCRPMKILVIGGGGREHALCWSLHRSPLVEEIFCAPGNPGIAEVADCLPVAISDIVEMADLAEKLHVDLTVVGPELPLSLGIADEFIKRELPIFGPTRLAAQIESSKVFSKEFFCAPQDPDPRRDDLPVRRRGPREPSRSTASRWSSRPTAWPAGRAS